jgi:hypothetical protein
MERGGHFRDKNGGDDRLTKLAIAEIGAQFTLEQNKLHRFD